MAAVESVFASEELVTFLLSYVEDNEIRQTILTLTRVFPRYYFPLQRLFQQVILHRPEQCIYLHRRLRGPHPDASLVRELRIQSWTADAEVVSNLLDVLEQSVNFDLATPFSLTSSDVPPITDSENYPKSSPSWQSPLEALLTCEEILFELKNENERLLGW